MSGTNSPKPAPAPPSATPAAPPDPVTQGVMQDPTVQSLLQQQQQGQQTYPQMQTAGHSPLQQQQFDTHPQQNLPPVQAPYPGQCLPSPQGPPSMGYNQYPPAQFQQTYPQMQQGNVMQQQQIYSPFQQGWGQQPTGWQPNPQNNGYNQGAYGTYHPQGMQAPYNGASGGFPPPIGQYPQAFPPMGGPITAGYPPTSPPPFIPPTIGYSLSGVEEAPLQMYPLPDCTGDVELIVKAFSSKFNTDEGALIQVLSKRSHPLEIASRKKAYASNVIYFSKKSKPLELLDIINNRTFNFSGGFKSITHALVAGPLELDVFLVRKAIKGAGTIEQFLDLVLLCRSNEDIKAISQHYREVSSSSKTLLQALEGDLSGDILALYKAVLLAERYWDDPTVPLPKEELERNINSVFAALTGKVDLNTVITFFVHGSFHRLASISQEWENVTNQKSLERYIEEKFHGHMEDALSYILQSAKDRTLAQAAMLDKSLRSSAARLGHKEEEIAVQVAKLVWEDQLRVGTAKTLGGSYTRGDFLKEVDSKYRVIQTRKDPKAYVKEGLLLSKIESETSGNFETFLVRLWKNQKA